MSEETVKSLKALTNMLEECRSLQATHAKLVLMFDGSDSGDGFELIVRTFDDGCAPPIKLDLVSMGSPDDTPQTALRRRKILLAPLINHMAWVYAGKMQQANAMMAGLLATLPTVPSEKT